jgi:hypothetical protein
VDTDVLADAIRDEMWEAIAQVRDASPRRTDDADTWDLVDAAVAPVGKGLRDLVERGQGLGVEELRSRLLELAARLDPSA